MVNDITKAFRVRDGISFDGDVFIFTGDIKPPSVEIPDAPRGSLYLYVTETETGLYQHNGTDWTFPTDPVPEWTAYEPHARPIFSVDGVYKSHHLTNDSDGYYFTLHRSVDIELRGISGSIYNIDSNQKIKGIDTEDDDDDDDDDDDTPNFPALYSLHPGYYRIQVNRWGSLMIILHGHSGAPPAWTSTNWSESATHTNDIFTWHDGPEDPWTV